MSAAPGPLTVPGEAADPPGLDLAALTVHWDTHVRTGRSGPLRARLVAGGRSNLTYLLEDGTTTWVLRRPPLGHVLATAHDMSREHRVMHALHGSTVPVPEMITLCDDLQVLGAPFYVMSFVDGTVFRTDTQLDGLSEDQAAVLADQLVDVLADLHAIEPAAVGLEALSRPDGYLRRQLSRWGRQLQGPGSRSLPRLHELGDRLAEAVPVTHRSSLVHGDYKLDNVVVDPETGRIRAVLDWEMATLGDPLMDLVNICLWWEGVLGIDGRAFAPAPAKHPTFPGAERLVDRYVRATGADLADLAWYRGMACFKLAAIFEAMHARSTQGLTVGDGFDGLDALAPALSERGHAALSERAG